MRNRGSKANMRVCQLCEFPLWGDVMILFFLQMTWHTYVHPNRDSVPFFRANTVIIRDDDGGCWSRVRGTPFFVQQIQYAVPRRNESLTQSRCIHLNLITAISNNDRAIKVSYLAKTRCKVRSGRKILWKLSNCFRVGYKIFMLQGLMRYYRHIIP